MGANRLLVVALGSAGRSLAQVSASFAVFCDGRRTPRLSEREERAREQERDSVSERQGDCTREREREHARVTKKVCVGVCVCERERGRGEGVCGKGG